MRLRTKENSKIAILEKLSRSLTTGRRLSPGKVATKGLRMGKF